MTLIIVCSFFTALFTFFLLRQRRIEKGKARKEIKSKNYGTGSWYKKRPGKNKGL